MSLTDALRSHTDLCEEIYQLMLDENRILKGSGRPPEDAFLDRKRQMLGMLSQSLLELRAAGARRETATPEVRGAMGTAQQTILRALLLDRENEQLLLKVTMPQRVATVAPRPGASQLEKIYGKHK